MRGLLEVTAIGNLGSNPKISEMPSGDLVANFSIAVPESYKDENGEWQERPEWLKCHAIGDIANIVQRLCQNGTQIYIKASFKPTKWVNKGGVHHSGFELRIQHIIVLSGGKSKTVKGGVN